MSEVLRCVLYVKVDSTPLLAQRREARGEPNDAVYRSGEVHTQRLIRDQILPSLITNVGLVSQTIDVMLRKKKGYMNSADGLGSYGRRQHTVLHAEEFRNVIPDRTPPDHTPDDPLCDACSPMAASVMKHNAMIGRAALRSRSETAIEVA
jgi:hypothetical protein